MLLLAAVACGNDHGAGDDTQPLPPPPATVSAGPVSIDTATMALTFGDALTVTRFIAVGDVESVDDTHYYDPTHPELTNVVGAHAAIGIDGDELVLDDHATRVRLVPGPIPDSAELDIDASAHANAVLVRISLPKAVAEPLYGTGDAAPGANVAGTVREMELRVDLDSESGLNETHTPVPLVLWPRHGLGALFADDRPAALDLGKTDQERVVATFTLPARGAFKVFLYSAAPDAPLDLVRDYVALTTKPAVPPKWAFAPMLWRNAWASGAELRADADQQRSLKVPGSTIWIDNPWQTAYNTFDIDTNQFPDPSQMIADLGAQGYNVIFWSTPYIVQSGITAPDFMTASHQDFFITDNGGLPLVYPWEDGPAGLIDFSNADATAFWQQKIDKVVTAGAKGFKLDFGEDLVPDLGGNAVAMELKAGDNEEFHARYNGLYHKAYLDTLAPGDGFLITRSGAWGEQNTNTCIWPGDLDSDMTLFGVDNGEGKTNVGGLPTAISRGLALSVSGYPFYGSDIGGFRDGANNGAPNTETLLRWAEYAAYGTIMQLGGGGPSHDPWDTTLFDADAAAIYTTYATLHMQLVPYLYALALRAGADGTPVTRPAAFMFDCACDDAMFLVGDDILVAPVISAGDTARDAILPPGTWVDATTGEVVTGDGAKTFHVPAARDHIPTWYRAGSLVPMYARYADTLLPATAAGVTSYADPALGGKLRFVYTPGGASSSTLDDGATASADSDTMSFVAGSEYTDATFDVDARSVPGVLSAPSSVTIDSAVVPLVADVSDDSQCTGAGCYSFDAASKHLQVRTRASGTIQVH